MKGKAKFFIIVFAFVLTVMSCANKDNKNVLSKDEMTSILIDIHLLESKIVLLKLKSDSMKRIYNTLEVEIMELHGTNKVDYEKNYRYYVGHPIILEEIYGRVVDSLNVINQVAQVASDKKKNAAKLKREEKARKKEEAERQKGLDSLKSLQRIDSMLMELEVAFDQTKDTSLFFVQKEIPFVLDSISVPLKSEYLISYDSLMGLKPEVILEETEEDADKEEVPEPIKDKKAIPQVKPDKIGKAPKPLSIKMKKDSIKKARKIQAK
ncbi:MAG: DUF4296 domain-containing protein [Reichenbachiella sp.]